MPQTKRTFHAAAHGDRTPNATPAAKRRMIAQSDEPAATPFAAMQSEPSKLDKLFALAHSGLSSSMREMIASQIAENVSKFATPPPALLLRVLDLLFSSSWDVRASGSSILLHLSQRASSWSPCPPTSLESTFTGPPAAASWKASTEHLMCPAFDVSAIIEKSAPLLAEAPTLPLSRHSEVMTHSEEKITGCESTIMESMEPVSTTLSSRQRNAQRRKFKSPSSSAAQKMGDKKNVPAPETPSRVIVSYKGPSKDSNFGSELESLDLYEGCWPFQQLCDKMAIGMLDPLWYIRHGSAIGLRCILSLPCLMSGTKDLLPSELNIELHRSFLLHIVYCTMRVLCLDRFTDFVGDNAVAPVRESCAQLLGVVVKNLGEKNPQDVMSIARGLHSIFSHEVGNQDLQNQSWTLKLSSLLGYKYLLAVRPSLKTDILATAFDVLYTGLGDLDDDVRAVSATAFLSVASTKNNTALLNYPNLLHRLLMRLWKSLETCDDLSASSASIIQLISTLCECPIVGNLISAHPKELSLSVLVTSFYKFFRHPLEYVRKSMLHAIGSLLDAEQKTANPKVFATWVQPELLRLVFQNYLLEEKMDVLEASGSLWSQFARCIARCSPPLMQLENLLEKFVSLACTPIGKPLDPKAILFASDSEDADRTLASFGFDTPMASQDFLVVSKSHIETARLMCAEALGSFFGSAADPVKEKFMLYVFRYFESDYAFQIQMASTMVRELSLKAGVAFVPQAFVLKMNLLLERLGENSWEKPLKDAFIELQPMARNVFQEFSFNASSKKKRKLVWESFNKKVAMEQELT